MPTLSIIVPNGRRSRFSVTMQSIWPQLEPGDEVIIDTNDDSYVGHKARNRQIPRAQGDWILLIDDDDTYLRDALKIVREAVEQEPDRVHIFQVIVKSSKQPLWSEPVLREGNVSQQCVAVPRGIVARFTEDRYEGDFDFIKAAIDELGGEPVWHEETIARVSLGNDWPLHTPHPDFPIIVPEIKGYFPSSEMALRQEGLSPTTRLVDDEGYTYGDMVAEAWNQGGFVLVEHDIVPWWGAVRELWECEYDWCVFPYPQGAGMPDPALGCCKFSDDLVNTYPRLQHDMKNVPWHQLQERILPFLWNKGYQWHVHWPPVAHARQREGP